MPLQGPKFSQADYAAALMALLPRGRVWPRDAVAVLPQVVGAFAPSLEQLDVDANALLVDAFPPSAVNLLPEWEATLGLPDPCAGPAPTIPLRQASVLARFIAGGGQSVPFFIALAATLGYAITIQEFTGSTALANKWQVTVANSGTIFATTESSTEDYIDVVETGAVVLQCEFNRLKPAHTTLVWNLI